MHPMDTTARRIFQAAMDEDKCGELMNCLLSNGAATVDAKTKKLVLISEEQVESLLDKVTSIE